MIKGAVPHGVAPFWKNLYNTFRSSHIDAVTCAAEYGTERRQQKLAGMDASNREK